MKADRTVMGIYAPPARPTARAALLLACLLSLPFAVLSLIEFLVF
jgi:hypothetical protein